MAHTPNCESECACMLMRMIAFSHDLRTGRMNQAQKGSNPTLLPWLFQSLSQSITS